MMNSNQQVTMLWNEHSVPGLNHPGYAELAHTFKRIKISQSLVNFLHSLLISHTATFAFIVEQTPEYVCVCECVCVLVLDICFISFPF